MLSTPEFWVGVAFLGFLALLAYYGVPGMVGKALDLRAAAIRTELEEARKLKEEAQALLADYERRRREAAKEAEAIIAQAKEEASALAHETRASLKESLERRTRLAEEKIARAEAQAVSDVRAAAIDAAVTASQSLIGSRLGSDGQRGLIDSSIAEMKKRLS
ncbi:MAG: F0F1 ATP synthase subunit B [Hyphomicrobiaceae bacterium]